MNRRLAAIVVADVVGYSRLLAEDEAGTLAALKERRKVAVEPLVKLHTGRIVKFLGDGVLIEFASAVNAVAFAVDLQRQMSKLNEPVPEPRRILLRIGINLGEVVGEGTDIFGEGVNVASRLETIAVPGGVAISGKVYDEVSGKLEAAFEDLGEKIFHNIAHPVRTYRLIAAAPTQLSSTARLAEPQLISVAVLPFANMSADVSQDYFADGLTEDLITALAKSRHLHVFSRYATLEYKSRVVNIPEIGRQLGARYVLEGSVRTKGNQVRVTAQLIDTQTGGHVWAERFDRALTDIFAVQDEIVGAIAALLAHNIIDAAVTSKRNEPTSSTSAYDHMLRGREAWRRGALLESFGHWENALAADESYAAALAILAFFYAYNLQTQVLELPPEASRRRALDFAQRAVATDDGDAFTHHSLGACYLSLGDLEKGLYHIDLATSINPHFPNTIMNRGLSLVFLGRHQDGIDMIQRAAALEPRLPPAMRGHYVDVHCMLGNADAAREALAHINNPAAFQFLMVAACLAGVGRATEARQLLAEFDDRKSPWFDVPAFVKAKCSQCRLADDRNRVSKGFRSLGFNV